MFPIVLDSMSHVAAAKCTLKGGIGGRGNSAWMITNLHLAM